MTVEQVWDSKLHQRQETYMSTSDSVPVATDTDNIKLIVDHQVVCCRSVGLKIDALKLGLLWNLRGLTSLTSLVPKSSIKLTYWSMEKTETPSLLNTWARHCRQFIKSRGWETNWFSGKTFGALKKWLWSRWNTTIASKIKLDILLLFSHLCFT